MNEGGSHIKVSFESFVARSILPFFPLQQKLLRLAAIAAGGTGFLGFILGYGGDERFYSRVVMPTLHRDPIQ